MKNFRKKYLKRFLKGIGLGCALLALSAASVLLWHTSRAPMAVLESHESLRTVGPATLLQQRTADGRLLRHVALDAGKNGTARLILSLPDPLPKDHPLPVILVLGGLGMGEENIRHIPDPGENILVGYDWPFPPRLPRGATALLAELPALRRQAHQAPGQIAGAMDWLAAQPYADPARISLLGFSLGALAGPAAQNVLARRGHKIRATVLGYGGAPIGNLLAAHPRLTPDWIRPMAKAVVNLSLWHLDPVRHLPTLEGRFLLLAGGDEDHLIPQAEASRYIALTPDPKEVVVLEGGHMGVGAYQTALLDEIIRISRAWLIEQGAINP